MSKTPSSAICLVNLNSPPIGHRGLTANDERASDQSSAVLSFSSAWYSLSLSASFYGGFRRTTGSNRVRTALDHRTFARGGVFNFDNFAFIWSLHGIGDIPAAPAHGVWHFA